MSANLLASGGHSDNRLQTFRPMRMAVRFPYRLSAGLNAREHHMRRANRVRAERFATAMHLAGMKHMRPVVDAASQVVVHLSRITTGTRLLDDDNLSGSLKAVRDQVATFLEVDDGSKLISFQYHQRRGPAMAVEIEIEWRQWGDA